MSSTAVTHRGEPEKLPYFSSTCYICPPFPSWHCSCSFALCTFLVEGMSLCFHLPSSGLQLRVSKSLLLLPNNLISLVWFEDTPSESLESNDLIPFIVSYMLLCFLVSFMYSWICLLHWRLFASWVLSWCLWDTGSFPTLPQHLPNWNLLESERSFLFSIDWKIEGFVEKQWVHFLFNFVGPFLVNYVIHVS